jgi:hypothetical protein
MVAVLMSWPMAAVMATATTTEWVVEEDPYATIVRVGTLRRACVFVLKVVLLLKRSEQRPQ